MALIFAVVESLGFLSIQSESMGAVKVSGELSITHRSGGARPSGFNNYDAGPALVERHNVNLKGVIAFPLSSLGKAAGSSGVFQSSGVPSQTAVYICQASLSLSQCSSQVHCRDMWIYYSPFVDTTFFWLWLDEVVELSATVDFPLCLFSCPNLWTGQYQWLMPPPDK